MPELDKERPRWDYDIKVILVELILENLLKSGSRVAPDKTLGKPLLNTDGAFECLCSMTTWRSGGVTGSLNRRWSTIGCEFPVGRPQSGAYW